MYLRRVELVTREFWLAEPSVDPVVSSTEPQASGHAAARLRRKFLEELLEVIGALFARIQEAEGVNEGRERLSLLFRRLVWEAERHGVQESPCSSSKLRSTVQKTQIHR